MHQLKDDRRRQVLIMLDEIERLAMHEIDTNDFEGLQNSLGRMTGMIDGVFAMRAGDEQDDPFNREMVLAIRSARARVIAEMRSHASRLKSAGMPESLSLTA